MNVAESQRKNQPRGKPPRDGMLGAISRRFQFNYYKTNFRTAFVGLGGINGSNWIDFIAVLFVFLFVDMFDTIGTLAGVGMQAGYTAPVLLIVGVLMAGSITEINWDDPAESIASFLTILFILLSFSIAEGLAVGFITYPLLKTFQGKAHETDLAV